METVLPLYADHTHLYPGARLTASDAPFAIGPSGTEVIVFFRDHTEADGVLAGSDDGLVLRVEGYSTGAGTAIEPKAWQVVVADDRT